VAGLVPAIVARRFPYNGSRRAILSRRLAVLLLCALPAGGCSFSYQMGSLFGTGDSADATGSIAKPQGQQLAIAAPPEADLALAKAAATDLLAKDGKATSAAWENPRTGARGTVTPIAAAYSQAGATCRDFLASYVKQGSEAWLQGEACRGEAGKWEVRSLTPWKRG
jgi:surface antigen